ncbi:DEAD/DEAH box helicase family protein [Roseateles sp.]|uniref:DEAD/DEAH box helicase family protein n=1 Tax=Roseateles sp. TaxID=1971397 RepID=UPI00286C37BC|nr:DEAD/DEAH box helicase family protein [Roseateles sp.]
MTAVEGLGDASDASDVGPFGISPGARARLFKLFESLDGVRAVWIFGSRAQGLQRPRSDIDLAVDAPDLDARGFLRVKDQIENLGLIYRTDVVWLQDRHGEVFKQEIEKHRKLLWQGPIKSHVDAQARQPGGAIELKPFQERVLAQLSRYLDVMGQQAAKAQTKLAQLRAMEDMQDYLHDAQDYPSKAWAALKAEGALPPAFAAQPHSSRFDGAGSAIPNVCLKVPTGGGKTLLAAASIAQVFGHWFKRHTGLVLWVVPNEAIYRQTLKTLSNRDHPYRQMLNVAGAGRVKVLEKNSPLTRQDVDGHLCVMVLMLASAARASKETLRFFRDRGNVLGFLPREDDVQAHWELLRAVPNLDVYAPFGASQAEARAQMGSIVKSSLGNVARMLRPMVVIDEGHHGYTENALKTLDGFNPGFLLELSATPRIASAKGSGSNILVDVRGTDLDEAQMIKLPIHVDVQHWSDWQSCLAAAVARLDGLQVEAEALRGETSRYIRPILLVQVERTGADTRDSGFIHAEDARAYLLQLGFTERQIAIKTSDKNELAAPENIDLLSPLCEVRAIITKQALQEGWDCPFAYVLCALAAGRNPAAMTQLVGRILRQPQVTKTGYDALDACYVLCHDAKTAEVVGAIKKSLEGEGMGDLLMKVTGASGESSANTRTVMQRRRPELAHLRLFLPRVSWCEPGRARRELAYESDLLARIDWAGLDAAQWVKDWAPNTEAGLSEQFDINLSILQRHGLAQTPRVSAGAQGELNRARLVRALIDLAPNAWLLWDWVQAAVQALRAAGHSEAQLAASNASLIERLRLSLEAERDRRAERVFAALVSAGQIEFALRADASDYELPMQAELSLSGGEPRALLNDQGMPARKPLLEPVYEGPELNGFEAKFAGYLDAKQAVHWWHRNVARTQYGLQGWKRHKVYPDFVFGLVTEGQQQRMVLMETKGAHLAGSDDTAYKQALLQSLSSAFRDQRWQQVGELQLSQPDGLSSLACDLLLDTNWQGALEARWFSP